jgi:hypothetical protein
MPREWRVALTFRKKAFFSRHFWPIFAAWFKNGDWLRAKTMNTLEKSTVARHLSPCLNHAIFTKNIFDASPYLPTTSDLYSRFPKAWFENCEIWVAVIGSERYLGEVLREPGKGLGIKSRQIGLSRAFPINGNYSISCGRQSLLLEPMSSENRTIFSLPSLPKRPLFVNASKLGGSGGLQLDNQSRFFRTPCGAKV